MRAKDMLVALNVKVFTDEYTAIGFTKKEMILLFTSIDIDVNDTLILYTDTTKPPLSIKNLLLQLMLNRQRILHYWDNEEEKEVFGFRITNKNIIL